MSETPPQDASPAGDAVDRPAPSETQVTVTIRGRTYPVDIEMKDAGEGPDEVRLPLTPSLARRIQPVRLDPVREFDNSPYQAHMPGLTYFASTHQLIMHESRQEGLALLELDLEGETESIAAQPFNLHFNRTTTPSCHTPDFFLHTTNGDRVLVDVKARRDIAKDAVQEQFAITQQVCRAVGWTYRVIVQGSEARSSNLYLITGFRETPADFSAVFPDMTEILNGAVITWAELVTQISSRTGLHPALVKPCILHGAWRGDITIDLDQELTLSSLVALRSGGGR